MHFYNKYAPLVAALLFLAGCSGSSGGGSELSGNDNTTADAESVELEVTERVFIAPQEVRVMAVGDSITHGVPVPVPSASWRLPFTLSLNEDGCLFEMVGSQSTNEGHSALVSPHESYSAHQAGHFITGFTNYAGTNDGIFSSTATYSPDVVLLHIGTNDAVQEQDNQETLQEIDQIITTILDTDSDVLVANIIPTFTEDHLDGVDARIMELGSMIEAYVAQLANPDVIMVDVRSGFTQDLMYDDGIHPNDRGSEHIADAFYDAFTANGYCTVGI